ncbi:sigma-54 interaction domain-containing protein [Desulfovibrio inopinatus]|uniref:sigma-54 interaction domain-containing protein n=1 Tax=Desulfovibrio inopinatus TaxID=102109 RepID=UPI000401CE3D|nr:sigma 54-interacting transcriptional regulator [Desulfovibrio inopinatus]
MNASPSPLIHGLFSNPVDLMPLLDEVPIPLAFLSLTGVVIGLNRAAEALTGYSRQEACGISCRYVFRSNHCVDACPLQDVNPQRRSFVTEADIINRDRQRIPVRLSFAPIRDSQGRFVGYLEAVEDMRLFAELDVKKHQAFTFAEMVGNSPQMERIFEILPGISQTDSSVLITGETGTGKDLLAEAIHKSSNRAKGPFVKVNCGALPETLLESELFGHTKGAFTGAVENKPGRFKLAQNGTLFLTEIGDLPLALQVKLLTFLDDKIIYPLGSTKGVPVDVRVVAATHRDLDRCVREGRFRQDLLFRLNVVRLHMPPIRERGEDVRLLLDHFLHFFKAKFNNAVKAFSPEALELLMRYPYPGNVRELRNIVEYAVNICGNERIRISHLPAYLLESQYEPICTESSEAPMMISGHFESERKEAKSSSESTTWNDVERRMILDALIQAGGRRGMAADILGWGRSTLWRKMKQHGIDGQ